MDQKRLSLSELAPVRGARKRRKLLGRGEASGHGKTSCRGGKGQTARTGGKIRAGFEGGQMPIYRRLPKRGFTSFARVSGANRFTIVNLETLNRFDNGAVVDGESLRALGIRMPSRNRAGIKILGNGELTKKLELRVHSVSSSAKSKIEALGGSVTIVGALAGGETAEGSASSSK